MLVKPGDVVVVDSATHLCFLCLLWQKKSVVSKVGYGAPTENANAASIAIGVANFYIPGLLPDRKLAKVDPNIFDSYTGQYQPDPSAILSITREGDKLMIQQGQGEKRELSPESETSFFIKDAPRST